MIDIKGFKRDHGMQGRGFKGRTVLIVALLTVFFAVYFVSGYIFEYIELREIGDRYTSVFYKNLTVSLAVQAISFMMIFVIALLNIFVIRNNLKELSLKRGILNTKKVSFLVAFVMALLLGIVVSNTLGERFLLFCNACFFGKTDPVFGKDIGYYLFQRPFLTALVDAVFNIWFFISCIVLAAYWFYGIVSGGYEVREMFSFRNIAVHNYINLGVLLLIKCFTYIFKAEEILYNRFGELQGAGFTDKVVWLSYYRIAPFLLIALIVFSLIFLVRGRIKKAAGIIAIYPAAWVLTGIVAFVVQTVVVSPNEVIRESENIAQNIEFTQAAYGIDNISEVEFEVNDMLSVDDLKKNENVTSNIRILDISANLTVLNQIQGIRNYYKFNETDIVPYEINGKKTAVAITPREITKENLSDSVDTYINRTLRYTHGFGVTMNPLNRVSAQGQPEFLIKDIPPKSAEGIKQIKQPRIYYGELTNDYVVVGNEKYKELDYSEGQEDIEFSYDGSGGLKLSFFNRLMFAIKYGDVRLLISDLVSSNSRILINRNIIERLKMAMPLLKYDSDPYIVIDSDGSLKWIVDAYTTTQYYPYSQSYGGFNYIRNSVKAVIDAYNGDVKFYISDKNDPIVMTYNAIYPELFEQGDMPEGIREHIKYPEYLFRVQSDVYGKYHISNPNTFYNKNDMWVIAKERYGTSNEEKEIAPYYNMMLLDNETEEELLLTIPYTLTNKDNMVAWLAVRNEWDQYGKLQVYKFPKDINVYGPMQIENRINSHAEISKELNLWSQGGSKVIRGNMIVVPIKNSILYVEPIYIASSNKSALPELKQVVIAYNEKIVMKSTITEALYALFNEKAPPDSVEGNEFSYDGTSYENIVKKVIDEFRRVQQATSQNNWNGFGESMTALEQYINELEGSLDDSLAESDETDAD